MRKWKLTEVAQVIKILGTEFSSSEVHSVAKFYGAIQRLIDQHSRNVRLLNRSYCKMAVHGKLSECNPTL